jgi:hypothetical protein
MNETPKQQGPTPILTFDRSFFDNQWVVAAIDRGGGAKHREAVIESIIADFLAVGFVDVTPEPPTKFAKRYPKVVDILRNMGRSEAEITGLFSPD